MALKKTKKANYVVKEKSSKKGKNKLSPVQQALNFYKEWKTTGIVILVVFLVFYLKIKEEGNSYINGKQAEEDLYGILELSSSATIKEIKLNYNKLVKEYHPDKNPSCTICPEKFSKISKAYEILSKKESKIHYDQTNGILEPLESQTLSLFTFNYHHLVEESPKPWIIQIYSENDSSCRTFSGFWEEFAKKHNYLNFGRINFGSQRALLKHLPYAVEELPLVISLVPGEHPELYGFYGDRSPNSGLETFLRKSFGNKYKDINSLDFSNEYTKRNDKVKMYLVGYSNIPTVFLYVSNYYKQKYDFYLTELGQSKQIKSIVNNDKVMTIITPSQDFESLPIRYFEGKQTKGKIISIVKYIHFLTIPEIFRFSFQDYCESAQTSSNSKDSYKNLPVACFLAIKNSGHFSEVEKLMKDKILEIEETIYQQSFEVKNNFNQHINKIQFGKIDLEVNKRFRIEIVEKVNIKNPKYIVYLSDINMIGVFNNLDEFNDIYQDLVEGVYEELRPLKELLKTDLDIHSLLVNENMTFNNIFIAEFSKSLGFKFLFFVFVFIFAFKYLKFEEKKAFLFTILLLVLYSTLNIFLKMYKEELI